MCNAKPGRQCRAPRFRPKRPMLPTRAVAGGQGRSEPHGGALLGVRTSRSQMGQVGGQRLCPSGEATALCEACSTWTFPELCDSGQITQGRVSGATRWQQFAGSPPS